jgi:hypothetical protein
MPKPGFESIFNEVDKLTSLRSMCRAGELGHRVNGAVIEFLRTRALIATKWHNMELARYSVFLRSEPGCVRQSPHTDFDPSKMSQVWLRQHEYEIAKSFSFMTVLQATKLYFVDACGNLVAEDMTAGDVVVWPGDTDHCGAEWTETEGDDAFAAFQDRFNYRLFSYVPSFYKPEFLVPWIVNDKNERLLRSKRINDDEARKRDLFDKTDPDKAKFCIDTFKKHLRYGAHIFEFDHRAYVLGLDSFPMRQLDERKSLTQVARNDSGAPCPHLLNARAEYFYFEDDSVLPERIQSQLQQLRKNCPYCSKSESYRKRPRALSDFDVKPLDELIIVWKQKGETTLAHAAESFVSEYMKVTMKEAAAQTADARSKPHE